MGFRPEPRTYTLQFTEPSLDGFEVKVRSVSLDEFMKMTGVDEETALGGVTIRDEKPVAPTLLEKIVGRIVSWNLDDDKGKPLPVTYTSLKKQDLYLNRALAKAYLEAVSGVSAPLDGRSGSGGTSPEEPPDLGSASQSLSS